MKDPRSLFNKAPGDAGDTVALLILAAKQDSAFRKQLETVLQLPSRERVAIVHTAVREMQMRGEPQYFCDAFVVLANDMAAATALKLLSES